jgi:hypothetical protein
MVRRRSTVRFRKGAQMASDLRKRGREAAQSPCAAQIAPSGALRATRKGRRRPGMAVTACWAAVGGVLAWPGDLPGNPAGWPGAAGNWERLVQLPAMGWWTPAAVTCRGTAITWSSGTSPGSGRGGTSLARRTAISGSGSSGSDLAGRVDLNLVCPPRTRSGTGSAAPSSAAATQLQHAPLQSATPVTRWAPPTSARASPTATWASAAVARRLGFAVAAEFPGYTRFHLALASWQPPRALQPPGRRILPGQQSAAHNS